MWNFKISYVGSAIAVFLFMLSLFVEYVYMANVKYKYQKIEILAKNTPLKIAKNILNDKHINVYFKRGHNFFQKDINCFKKIIRIEDRTFFKSSIYDNVNSVFLAYKYYQMISSYSQNNILHNLKIIIGFFAINLIWTLLLGLWIIILILGICFILLLSIYIHNSLKLDLKAAKFSLEYFYTKVDNDSYIFIKKYIKYKKIESIILSLKIFTQPTIDVIKIIKNWGHDD